MVDLLHKVEVQFVAIPGGFATHFVGELTLQQCMAICAHLIGATMRDAETPDETRRLLAFCRSVVAATGNVDSSLIEASRC